MSVKVDLLPREVEEGARSRRIMRYSGAGVGLVILVLGLVYVFKVNEVSHAENVRDEAQAEVTRLEARVDELEEYRLLAEALETRNQLLADAMEKEISFARTLNDLSLAFPSNASLLTLSATAAEQEDETPGAEEIDFGAHAATAEFTGYSVERFAPGVETVLLDFEEIRTFFNPFLATAESEDIGDTEVMNFHGSVELDEDAYTRRYADGLPPEEQP